MEELNKNIPEDENTTETTEEMADAPEATEESVEEVADDVADVTDEEVDEILETLDASETEDAVPAEELSPESPSRPANLLRSAITAAVVLAVFAAVYFIFTAVYDKGDAPKAPSSEQKPLVETSVSEAPGNQTPSETSAEDSQSDPQAENKPAPSAVDAPPSPEYTAASNKITADAKQKYGDGIVVLPEYNHELKTVKIDGTEHKCFMAAVVKFDPTQESGTSIIHATIDSESNQIWYDDATTWEIID